MPVHLSAFFGGRWVPKSIAAGRLIRPIGSDAPPSHAALLRPGMRLHEHAVRARAWRAVTVRRGAIGWGRRLCGRGHARPAGFGQCQMNFVARLLRFAAATLAEVSPRFVSTRAAPDDLAEPAPQKELQVGAGL